MKKNPKQPRPAPRPTVVRRDNDDDERLSDRRDDSGIYRNGYRIYRDGSMREDFGSDR